MYPERFEIRRATEDFTLNTLYTMCRRAGAELETRHAADPIGLVRAKGELATRAGFLVTLVSPDDPNDPEKVRSLLSAAASLGITVDG